MTDILVADDDHVVRETVRQILEEAGYDVRCAADGVEALVKFREKCPDLVITDIIMPEKEGIQTILELRGEWPQGKILAISGGGRIGNADFLRMALSLGANAILAKPFDPDELLAKVEECLAA
jgi:DNA-binding response OmpR family regulator